MASSREDTKSIKSSKRSSVLVTTGLKLSKAWKNDAKREKMKTLHCGLFRTSNILPPIVEQCCCYLEQHGKI